MLRPMQNTQDISAEELRILQETDPTLGVVRNAACGQKGECKRG